MEFAHKLLLYISVTALIFLLIGLYSPWVMLWWEDMQNRRKVVKLYGGISVVTYTAYFVLDVLVF